MTGFKYEYKNLGTDGYTKFSISRSDQNRIFKYRKSKWSISYEYYIKGDHIVMQAIPNVIGCIASTLLLPIALIAEGVVNYREVYKDMILRAWQCKKYGAFSSDDIYKGRGGEFEELLKLVSQR